MKKWVIFLFFIVNIFPGVIIVESMKKLLVFSFVMLFQFQLFCMELVTGDVWGGNKYKDDSFYINDGVNYSPETVYLRKTIQIENEGLLKTDIYLCERCDLFLRNRGVVDSAFNLSDTSRLYQVVSEAADMTSVDFGVEYSVLVDATDELSMLDVLKFADDAKSVVLQNSVLDINGVAPGIDKEIEIKGNVVLLIDDLSGLYDIAFLKNVSGAGGVRVVTDSHDLLYVDMPYVQNNTLFFTRMRETDYSKIFKDNLGNFLNQLRAENPNDGLLNLMDNAHNMTELHNIMGRSARLNPDVLLRLMYAVDVVNQFDLIDAFAGVNTNAMFVLSDDFYVRGLTLGCLDNVFEKLKFSISVKFGDVRYEADANDFVGLFYGVHADLDYLLDSDVFINSDISFMRYVFDIDKVFYNGKKITYPSGIGVRASSDVGYKYNFNDSFYLKTFVGAGGFYDDVETKYSLGNMFMQAGVVSGVVYEMLGVKYNYDLQAKINSESDVEFLMRAAFWSEMDMLGGNVSVGIADALDATMYTLAIGVQLQF